MVALGDVRAVPGPCPRAVSPSLDATVVSGRVLVVPDQFGFPTDMGCIGPIEVPTPGFFPGIVAGSRSTSRRTRGRGRRRRADGGRGGLGRAETHARDLI